MRRILALAFIFQVAPAFCAETLPDTELGDVIIRRLDIFRYSPIFPVYSGHAGILDQWDGNDAEDPADYFVYDMKQKSSTRTWEEVSLIPPRLIASTATIVQRTFESFVDENQLLSIFFKEYSGGYTRGDRYASAAGPAMTPSSRQDILTEADTWLDRDLWVSFLGFSKQPADDIFRCDSWIEYVLEQAGINFGKGLWKDELEHLVPSPYFYATLAGDAEPGDAPAMSVETGTGETVNDGDAINETTIVVSATETATGSGLKSVVLDGPSGESRSVSGLTATETFSSLADGSYSVTVYDRAGNHQGSVGFKGKAQPLLVGAQLRAVRRSGAFGGLKSRQAAFVGAFVRAGLQYTKGRCPSSMQRVTNYL